MYTVTWNRWGRAAGKETFDTRDAALKLFNRVRRMSGVTRAEMNPV
jgi:hypothetical protein